MPTHGWVTDQSLRMRSYRHGRCVVALEGPDLAGKSTVARQVYDYHLSLNRDVAIVHNGPPPRDVSPHASLVDLYIDQILHPEHDVTILDRSYVGELVYGPKYRGASRVQRDGRRLVEAALTYSNAIRVFLDPGDQELLARFRGPRGDDMVHTEEDLIDVAERYRDEIGSDSRWLRWGEETRRTVMW